VILKTKSITQPFPKRQRNNSQTEHAFQGNSHCFSGLSNATQKPGRSIEH
jgi:hypothetical protein